MELSTAVSLIEKGVRKDAGKQVWADLGAGKGLFTKALATLLSKGSTLCAVDKDVVSLHAITLPTRDIILKKIQHDFGSDELAMDKLDGVVMANSLHFIADKESLIRRLKNSLTPSGRIIVVEYNMDVANPWVPYPISYLTLQKLASPVFSTITQLGEAISIYGRAHIYSALLLPDFG